MTARIGENQLVGTTWNGVGLLYGRCSVSHMSCSVSSTLEIAVVVQTPTVVPTATHTLFCRVKDFHILQRFYYVPTNNISLDQHE